MNLTDTNNSYVPGAKSAIRHEEFRRELRTRLSTAEWDDYCALEIECMSGVATTQERARRDTYERCARLPKW